MSLKTISARAAGAAAAAMMAAVFATPTQADIAYGDVITIHESITINESPVAIWTKFGNYCAIPTWVPPIKSCVYEEGDGQLGSVRRLDIDGIGEVVELMSVRGQTLYTYEMTEGFLTDAKYRSTIWAVPGTSAGTAEVHWKTTILRSAFPDDGGVGIATTLSGLYQASLGELKRLAE